MICEGEIIEREERIKQAHELYDHRDIYIELGYQRDHFKHGYVSKREALFNTWVFDTAFKRICDSEWNITEAIQKIEDSILEPRCQEEMWMNSGKKECVKIIKEILAKGQQT